jgi:hypothetical protein
VILILRSITLKPLALASSITYKTESTPFKDVFSTALQALDLTENITYRPPRDAR